MFIDEIKLINFRNYESLKVRLSPKLNIIAGENAQGKTNLLEAIFLCTFGRSHRTSRDEQLIKWDSPAAYASVNVVSPFGKTLIEYKQRVKEPKTMHVNGTRLGRIGDLMGHIRSVMFSPETLDIVKGSPEDRRRFMDMAISQLYPAYFFKLSAYNKALKQKNALLRPDSGVIDTASMYVFNAQLAGRGAEVMRYRREFIKELDIHASKLQLQISKGRDFLRLSYAPSLGEAFDDETAFLDMLEKSLQDDIRRGFTGKGPHRDDIRIMLDDQDMRSFGSQGQQRTAALSMKLSEVPVIRAAHEDAPVLLLDDVFSELDGLRRRELLLAMKYCQCILTTTSLDGIGDLNLPDTRVFYVKSGMVEYL